MGFSSGAGRRFQRAHVLRTNAIADRAERMASVATEQRRLIPPPERRDCLHQPEQNILEGDEPSASARFLRPQERPHRERRLVRPLHELGPDRAGAAREAAAIRALAEGFSAGTASASGRACRGEILIGSRQWTWRIRDREAARRHGDHIIVGGASDLSNSSSKRRFR